MEEQQLSPPKQKLTDQAIKKKLNELKIKDEDDFHAKVINAVLQKGVDGGLAGYSDDMAPSKLRQLTEALKKLDVSDVFTLAFEVDFNYFNALDSFDSTHVDFQDAVEKSFGNCNFAEVIAKRMIYLIKRQQDMREFLKDLQKSAAAKACRTTSLRQLLCGFLTNCSHDVRVKCYQLLSANNPVPAIIDHDSGYLTLESYWIATADEQGTSTITRILSCGLEATCKGKSKLLNRVFNTSFEENVYGQNQGYFNGTIDMQLVRNFGASGNHLCVADAHGVVDEVLLERMAGAFDAILVHLDESSCATAKYIDLIGKLASRQSSAETRLIVIVRDSKSATRIDCCKQEKIKPSLVKMSGLFGGVHGDRIKVCRVPSLVRDNQAKHYDENLRAFLFDELYSVATNNQVNLN